jgi:hypothetical protein
MRNRLLPAIVNAYIRRRSLRIGGQFPIKTRVRGPPDFFAAVSVLKYGAFSSRTMENMRSDGSARPMSCGAWKA